MARAAGHGFNLRGPVRLYLELMLLFALTYCTMTLRSGRAHVTPLFVLLLLVFVLTAIPLIYSVSNFGTLFRLRQMLYTLMALMPLTLAPAG